MVIREAKHKDIPQILKVLKASLGETSSKKTEAIWRYKHIDNPFGESLVLVAEEGNEIVGVRAFMRWKWQKGKQVYSAFRAVDTATHPDHQGKGIFKKLTLKALEIGKERGDHFVFNTPNAQSKPGYLKMGWKEVDRLKVHLRPLNILRRTKKIGFQFSENRNSDCENLLKNLREQNIGSNQLFTPKDWAYLKWRYLNNPLQTYDIEVSEDHFIAGYLKDRGAFKEYRISEIIVATAGINWCKRLILKKGEAFGAQILSISPNNLIYFKAGITANFGPVLTFRPMNVGQNEFLNLNSWTYSLGDLELF